MSVRSIATRGLIVPACVVACGALAGCPCPIGLSGPYIPWVSLNDRDPRLAPVDWLAGSWYGYTGENETTEEHWTPADGATMLGVNRTVRDGETVFFEYLRIEARDDGIVYLASPKGRQPPTEFRLVVAEEGRLVVENPEHDFPKRIFYERDGGDLILRIEGVENGEPRSVEWRLREARFPPKH